MLSKYIKFYYCIAILFISHGALLPRTNASSNQETLSNNATTKLKKFTIKKINIPVVFEERVNLLVFDVEFFVITNAEVLILENNIFVLIDEIITDTFDSIRVLIEKKENFTKVVAEQLRKRIWILCAKKLFSINKYLKIRNLKLTSIKYMAKKLL